MGQQAVLLEDGIEIDWIDPVVLIAEDEHEWCIHNGRHEYVLEKKDNRELIVRNMEPQ